MSACLRPLGLTEGKLPDFELSGGHYAMYRLVLLLIHEERFKESPLLAPSGLARSMVRNERSADVRNGVAMDLANNAVYHFAGNRSTLVSKCGRSLASRFT